MRWSGSCEAPVVGCVVAVGIRGGESAAELRGADEYGGVGLRRTTFGRLIDGAHQMLGDRAGPHTVALRGDHRRRDGAFGFGCVISTPPGAPSAQCMSAVRAIAAGSSSRCGLGRPLERT